MEKRLGAREFIYVTNDVIVILHFAYFDSFWKYMVLKSSLVDRILLIYAYLLIFFSSFVALFSFLMEQMYACLD